jgi:cyclic pyranopterin phosphate synthase
MSASNKLTHINEKNQPAMVNVGQKKVTYRLAKARTQVLLPKAVCDALVNGDIQSPKGPVFHTAILAGTMAAKKTGDLIPFCHPIGIDNCTITIELKGNKAVIECTCEINAKTGIEMEALTGATVAALTLYDMCKAISSEMVIEETRLIEKRGGKKDFLYED